ncbi:hypothetical protein BC827DRAFT_1313978 [Russula dissimulans]|nr:hypothetical protein BC827DRAFT_1313978 [Russula dissimulans]
MSHDETEKNDTGTDTKHKYPHPLLSHACPPACPPAHIPAHPHACLPLSVHVACLLGQVSITSTTLCHRSQQLSATQVIQDMGPYAGDNLSTQLAANLGFAVRLTLGRDLSQPHYLPMVLGYKASTVFLASPYLTTMEPPNLGSKSYLQHKIFKTWDPWLTLGGDLSQPHYLPMAQTLVEATPGSCSSGNKSMTIVTQERSEDSNSMRLPSRHTLSFQSPSPWTPWLFPDDVYEQTIFLFFFLQNNWTLDIFNIANHKYKTLGVAMTLGCHSSISRWECTSALSIPSARGESAISLELNSQRGSFNPEFVKLNPNATLPTLTRGKQLPSIVKAVNHLVSVSQKKLAPEISIKSVEYEAGIDSNFVLITARNDEELAAVSISFVTTFTKSREHPLSPEDLAGSHTDVYPLSSFPSFPGARSLEEVRHNTRGTNIQATLQRADNQDLQSRDAPRRPETLRTSTAFWDDIKRFIVGTLPAAIDRGPFIAGAESEVNDFHVAACQWLVRIAYVVGAQRSDEGVSALEKRFRPIPHKIEVFWDT